MVKSLYATLLALLGILIQASVSVSAQPQKITPLEKDLNFLLEWFPGRFDNSLQVFWEPQLEVPEEDRHYRRHSIFRRVDLPKFGDHVLYAEQYRDGDPDAIYRQRLYVFSVDETEGAIRLQIHIPKNPDRLKGAYRDPDLLKRLRPTATRVVEGCDVLWRRQANQFIGHVGDGTCRFWSQQFGKDIVLDESLILTENELWLADRGLDEAGEYVFGMKGETPSKLRRVRPFECWAAILRGAAHGDSGEGQSDWDFRRGVWLHDQQGEAVLTTDEDPARRIMLRLRRVEWPTGSNRPSLTLYVHEGNNSRATSYAWTEYDAERVGINLRWLQASCSHAPDRLYEDGR